MPKGKVAIVTGASRGIGRSIALALAAEGAKIVAVDMAPEGVETLAAEIKAQGGEALAVQGNVTVTADAERMVDVAVEAFGRADILVNNAGITP
jgi:3-oxoacyl-[acyl-carrier protein] reductase